MKTPAPLVYEFGPYRLEPDECRLFKQGKPVKLRPKLFVLLAMLVEHHGHMLERDKLLDAVWPDMRVEESNLTVSIRELRKVLGHEQWIETVAGHGYRFAAAVKATQNGCATAHTAMYEMEPTQPGGALPLYSRFYLERDTDQEFRTALARRDSLVLVKGARQIGKTSLLARGLQQAREAGAAIVLTDFQHIT
jgi:DNA-binding winged helix-turn-helix (wHTH) protein